MRGGRTLTFVSAFVLWLATIGGVFIGIAIATSCLYQFCGICYRFVKQSPTYPVDRFGFASTVACLTALLLIGVFAGHRPVRANVLLTAIWFGSLIGVLAYLAVVMMLEWRLI
jgi:hypothetical protein